MDKKNKRSRQTSQPRPASMHCLWTAIDRHSERENTGKTYKDTYGKIHADGNVAATIQRVSKNMKFQVYRCIANSSCKKMFL